LWNALSVILLGKLLVIVAIIIATEFVLNVLLRNLGRIKSGTGSMIALQGQQKNAHGSNAAFGMRAVGAFQRLIKWLARQRNNTKLLYREEATRRGQWK
jgi:hypothetical protein